MIHNAQQTRNIFARLFRGGMMRRMPRGREDTRVFLAVAASTFDPQLTYTEHEVNEHLGDWMADFADLVKLDHVTVRRHLADHYFLLRDAAGSWYRANQAIINSVIEPAARAVQPRYVLDDVQSDRSERKARKARSGKDA